MGVVFFGLNVGLILVWVNYEFTCGVMFDELEYENYA